MTRLRSLTLIGALVLGVVLAATPAQAAPVYPPPTPSPSPSQPGNSISTTVVPPGGTFTVTVAGYLPGETILFVIHSTPVQLAAVNANASGSATATLTIPSNIPTGSHTITATGATSGHVVSFAVQVQQATAAGGGPGLSNTGVATVALGTVAGIFLIGGIAFTFAGRRRNNAARSQ
jgi:hypothetical protein